MQADRQTRKARNNNNNNMDLQNMSQQELDSLLVTSMNMKSYDYAIKLIDAGADLRCVDKTGTCVLESLLENHADADTVMAFLERGAYNPERDLTHDPCIFALTRTVSRVIGYGKVFEKMIEQGMDINVKRPYNGGTLMHYAVVNVWGDMVEELTRLGARSDIEDSEGYTALDYKVYPDNVYCKGGPTKYDLMEKADEQMERTIHDRCVEDLIRESGAILKGSESPMSMVIKHGDTSSCGSCSGTVCHTQACA